MRDIGLVPAMEEIACHIEEDKRNLVVFLGLAVDYCRNPVVAVAEVVVVVAADHIDLVVAEDILLLLHHMRTH